MRDYIWVYCIWQNKKKRNWLVWILIYSPNVLQSQTYPLFGSFSYCGKNCIQLNYWYCLATLVPILYLPSILYMHLPKPGMYTSDLSIITKLSFYILIWWWITAILNTPSGMLYIMYCMFWYQAILTRLRGWVITRRTYVHVYVYIHAWWTGANASTMLTMRLHVHVHALKWVCSERFC